MRLILHVSIHFIGALQALPLEWYPLTRDCLFYSISVILLIVFLGNRQVFWYEALVLVLAYAVYIFGKENYILYYPNYDRQITCYLITQYKPLSFVLMRTNVNREEYIQIQRIFLRTSTRP